MTEAGWTREKPTVAGWYWYKVQDEDGEALEIVQANISEVDGNRYFYFTFDEAVYEEKDMDGEWQGPIAPTDRQRGRVVSCAWKYDDMDDYYETACKNAYCLADGTLKDNDHKYCPYCGGLIQLAQQAQEVQLTKEDNHG